jgi:hypothetical protein
MNIEQLARKVADKGKVDPWNQEFCTLTKSELERFAALVRNEVLEGAAAEFQKFLDLGEEEKAKNRADEALESGDEDRIVRALRHQSNVDLYNNAIHRCMSVIRSMKTEVKP